MGSHPVFALPRWRELRELTWIRLMAFVRRPEAMFWVFAFPLVVAAVLGFAFRSGAPAPNRVGVLAGEATAPWLVRLEADEHAEIVRFADREQAEVALRSAHIDALVLDSTRARPTLRLDPTRPEAEVARLRVLVALGEVDPASLELDEKMEHGSRYVDFLFPGLLGMNLMGTGMWAIGFALAELRQRRVLKRLLVTPMRRSSFLGSFLLARVGFLATEILVLTAFGLWFLEVPLRGSPVLFASLCAIGGLTFAGLGLLSGSRVTTIEGASGMLNAIMGPMWLGSGVFFDYERFPDAIHPILRLLPLTALNDALRDTMLEGAILGDVVGELAVLLAWGVLSFALALRVFRWE